VPSIGIEPSPCPKSRFSLFKIKILLLQDQDSPSARSKFSFCKIKILLLQDQDSPSAKSGFSFCKIKILLLQDQDQFLRFEKILAFSYLGRSRRGFFPSQKGVPGILGTSTSSF
jgi:hypothetical protein